MREIRKSGGRSRETYLGKHRFEHWYRDQQVYFITARCRGRTPAFAGVDAQVIFWRQFERYTAEFGFEPWVTSLVFNHYHTLGFLHRGSDLPKLMQRFHGSVAKLVNDTLPERLVPFWIDSGRQNYFDGCIRDEQQCRRAYGYVLRQSVRHGLCDDWSAYSNTRVGQGLEDAVAFAHRVKGFFEGVPYKRYLKKHAD